MRNVSAHTGRLNFCEARRLETEGSRLITARAAEKLLVEPAMDESLHSIRRFWTGTIVAYPKAKQAFGYQLQVPYRPMVFLLDTSDFRGERNIALVFDKFDLVEQGPLKVYAPKEIIPVTAFPQESGWYSLHESGVPVMNGKGDHFLWRWEDARVGPVVRAFGRDRHDVFIHHRPSEKLPSIFTKGEIPEHKAEVISIQAASRK